MKFLNFMYPQREVVLIQNSTLYWPYVVDVSKMFYSSDAVYCPKIDYEIEKVYNGTSWIT